MTSVTEYATHSRRPITITSPARLVVIAAITLGLSTTQTNAQAVDYGALQQLFGEPVTTSATGSPQRETDVPADMQIITAEDIRRSGADNIPDILQFVAGVDVRRYGVADAEVSVRGYDQQFSPRLLVLINGRQVYLDDEGHTAWQSLPVQIDEIRQIEIVMGPNSALFGFNAAGGVINIITYDPIQDSTNAASVRGGTQSYASGSAVMTLHDGDQAGLRLSAGGFRANEFSTSSLPADLGPFDRTPDAYSVSGDGRLMLAPKVELTAEATASNAQSFDVLPTPAFSDDLYRTASFKLGVAADTGLGLLDLSAYENELYFGVRSIDAQFSLNNDVFVAKADDLFKIGADNTFRLGVEYRDNSASGAPFGGTIGYTVYASSAMWSWQVLPELNWTNAVRLDHLTLDYKGTIVPDDEYTLSDYDGHQLNALSFNSGLVYKPTDDDTFRLLAARGVEAPSLVDFGLQSSVPTSPPISFVGNPSLEATSVTNYEFDYDRTLTAIDSVLHGAVFDQRTANLLASGLTAPLVPGAGGLVGYAQNVGNSSASGGEVGLKSESAPGIHWSISYSFISISEHFLLNSLSVSPGSFDYQLGSPASVIDAGLGYSWDRLSVDAQARWQSQYVDNNPTVNDVSVPVRINDYTTESARIAYRVSDSVTLALSGEQLLQSQILEAAGIPVERQITISISSKF